MMIFRLLSTEDLLRNVSRVSKRFYELATDAAVHIHVRLNDRVRFVAKSFLVFDSNCERALPLVLETLDYCCSTDKKEGAFKRVYKGYRFREPPEKKKKKLDQLKKEFNIDFFTDEIGSDLF